MTYNLKYLLIIVCFLYSFVALAQQVTFEKNYDFGYADVAYCVQQTPDSGYIMAGRQGIAPFYEKMVIAKTDQFGILQWQKIIGSSANSAWANYIVNCTDGGYAAVGYQYDLNYRYDVFVVRLDNNGDTLWTKHYGKTTMNERGNCIKELPNKNFIISFETDQPDSTGLLKIDSVGNKIWIKRYSLESGIRINHVSNLNNGNFISCGILLSASSIQYGFAMCTNNFGDTLWTRKYLGTNGAEFYETQQTNDGNIVIAGGNYNDKWGGYYLKLNLDGDTIWTKKQSLNEIIEMKSINQCLDGGFIATGSIYNPLSISTYNQNAYLVKLDSSGNTEWTKEFGDPVEDEGGYYVRQTYDKGFIICGLYESPVNFYLVKTDSIGNLITNINEIKNKENYSIYPNPTQNKINLIFKNEAEYSISILTLNGQLIFKTQILEDEATSINSIDVSNFSNGIYFITILSNNFTVTKKIIKIN